MRRARVPPPMPVYTRLYMFGPTQTKHHEDHHTSKCNSEFLRNEASCQPVPPHKPTQHTRLPAPNRSSHTSGPVDPHGTRRVCQRRMRWAIKSVHNERGASIISAYSHARTLRRCGREHKPAQSSTMRLRGSCVGIMNKLVECNGVNDRSSDGRMALNECLAEREG